MELRPQRWWCRARICESTLLTKREPQWADLEEICTRDDKMKCRIQKWVKEGYTCCSCKVMLLVLTWWWVALCLMRLVTLALAAWCPYSHLCQLRWLASPGHCCCLHDINDISSYCCSGLPHQHRNILNGWAHIITHVCSLGRIQDQTNILLLGKARRMSRHTGKSFLKAQWTNVVVWTPESALRPTILMVRVQALRGNLKFQNMLLKIKKLIIIFKASQPIQLFSHEVVFIISGKMFLHPILFKVWGCLNEPPPFWWEILSCQICCWNK